MHLTYYKLSYNPTLRKKKKKKTDKQSRDSGPVGLNGGKLDLNGILIGVSKVKRKNTFFVRAVERSSRKESAVLIAPALSCSLSAQK